MKGAGKGAYHGLVLCSLSTPSAGVISIPLCARHNLKNMRILTEQPSGLVFFSALEPELAAADPRMATQATRSTPPTAATTSASVPVPLPAPIPPNTDA